jgi:hypothetical protein
MNGARVVDHLAPTVDAANEAIDHCHDVDV